MRKSFVLYDFFIIIIIIMIIIIIVLVVVVVVVVELVLIVCIRMQQVTEFKQFDSNSPIEFTILLQSLIFKQTISSRNFGRVSRCADFHLFKDLMNFFRVCLVLFYVIFQYCFIIYCYNVKCTEYPGFAKTYIQKKYYINPAR